MLKKVYKGPLESFFKRMGLHSILKNSYVSLRLLTQDPNPITVRGIEVKFNITTYAELLRIQNIDKNEELLFLLDELQPDDIYWDIGSNIGTHTIPPAIALTQGQVVAIEAHPENVTKLRRNIELNNLQNVDVEEVALGDAEGEIELSLMRTETEAGQGQHSIVEQRGKTSLSVPMIRGDSLLEKHDLPTVIKLDIEGAEVEALKGMPKVLDNARMVLCEVHTDIVNQDDVHAILEEHDFKIQEYNGGNNQQIIARSRNRNLIDKTV